MYAAPRREALAGSLARSKVNFTSSAVTGCPSCHFTSLRSLNTTALSESSQLCASQGTAVSLASYWMSGVNSMKRITSSVVAWVFTTGLKAWKSLVTAATAIPPVCGGPPRAPPSFAPPPASPPPPHAARNSAAITRPALSALGADIPVSPSPGGPAARRAAHASGAY
jgi:hypothetical protein